MQDIKQDYVEPAMEIIQLEYVFTLTQSTAETEEPSLSIDGNDYFPLLP